jgi:ABC-type antimicrobial peptide transport system permease subunit
MYIYEALSVILAAILLGTGVGIAVAVTLVLEFNLFLELPFFFNFPYMLYFIVVGIALSVAVLGSWLPAYQYQKKKIASALKGL